MKTKIFPDKVYEVYLPFDSELNGIKIPAGTIGLVKGQHLIDNASNLCPVFFRQTKDLFDWKPLYCFKENLNFQKVN